MNQGIVFVRMVSRDRWQKHQTEVVKELRRRFENIPAGQAFVSEGTTGVGRMEAPVQLVLEHPDIDELARQQGAVMTWMRGQPQFIGVDSDLKMNKPQVSVSINREKAAEMGISVSDISNTMRFLQGGKDPNY